jgi:hypothetical protein
MLEFEDCLVFKSFFGALRGDRLQHTHNAIFIMFESI